jgi:ferredoxin
MTLRPVIDHGLCEGHGRCADLLPSVFETDEAGFGRVREDAAMADEASLRRVVALCPMGAISLDQQTPTTLDRDVDTMPPTTAEGDRR